MTRRPQRAAGRHEALSNTHRSIADIFLKESAVKRLVEPQEVGSLAVWLASPSAGMVTGASYTMDGGWTAR